MENTFKSAKTVFARFSSTMKPQTAEWRTMAGDWVNTALVAIGNAANLKEVVRTVEVRNHRFNIPQGAKSMSFIVYNGERLHKKNDHLETWYVYDNTQPNYIRTSFKEGTIQLVFFTLNLDVDGYPLIPNELTGQVDEYLFFCLCRQWLLTGNKHTVLKYDDVDARIEGPVGRRDLGLKFAARNSMNWLSADDMEVLRDKTIGLYQHYDRYLAEAPADNIPFDPDHTY